MNAVAIVGREASLLHPNLAVKPVTLKQLNLECCLIPGLNHDKPPPAENEVLLKVKAFSCNYRDQALLFHAYLADPETCLWPVGSELVGDVVEVGSAVDTLQVGDRVIGNNVYHGAVFAQEYGHGVVTNNASLEYQTMSAKKLIKVPEAMPDEVAAAFSLGAQTAYSMIRRARLTAKDRVLVLSASSSTSLFVLAALKASGIETHAMTSAVHIDRIRGRYGVCGLVERTDHWKEDLKRHSLEVGGFDAIIDPFIDAHVGGALTTLKAGGRYVTCGFMKQFPHTYTYARDEGAVDFGQLVQIGIVNNLELVFNCLGRTEDLEAALHDFELGKLDVLIDSVFRPGEEAEFFRRTFESAERFGKVVFRYGRAP